ncbi:MAG: hypothetical protein QW797_04455 [Thermoproteota archaeon]
MKNPWNLTLFFLFLLLSSYAVETLAQPEGLSINVNSEIDIAYFDSKGEEKFRLIIEKNGGISEIRMSQVTYASPAESFIWNNINEGQSASSDATAEPIIENKGDYITLTCYGAYRNHSVSAVTDITVSKIGLIVIRSAIRAEQSEPTILRTGWIIHFPTGLLAGEKAYVNMREGIREVNLPVVNFSTGGLFGEVGVVYWMDFSKTTEGITLINMAPDTETYYDANIYDARVDGYDIFSAEFEHTRYGMGSMPEGSTRVSKVALYLHGPGGYSENLAMINLVSGLADAETKSRNVLKSYQNPQSKTLASQALNNAMAGLEKLFKGDIEGAEHDLEQAKSLLKQADETEILTQVLPLTLVAVVVILALLLIIMRRKRRKTRH